MPTGYTAAIEKGITFNQFAMDCARNFGALVLMRDEPAGAPIPEEFPPNDYNSKRLEEAKAELVRITAMSAESAQSEADKEAAALIESDRKQAEESRQLLAKYQDMLKSVKAWNPPTPDHKGLKDFMMQKIEESIKFDCGAAEPDYAYKSFKGYKTGLEWKSEKTLKAIRDIAYHEAENAKEIERAKGRTRWVKQLRDSLAPTTTGEA
jgi:hypothetical protein